MTVIFKLLVQSLMLYDAETWTVAVHQQNKLIAMNMDFFPERIEETMRGQKLGTWKSVQIWMSNITLLM